MNYTRERARQFAYDDPRARFMDRDVHAGTYAPDFSDAASNRWTDYAGVIPWGDFGLSFSGGQPLTSEKVRYLGTAAHQKVSDGSKQYYHGDLIDSVWVTTAGDATPGGYASYAAFGELLDSNGSPHGGGPPPEPPSCFGRYQYAGGWGYESPAGEGFPGAAGGLTLTGVNPALPPITLIHVGARWYDPSLGRFLQRDPIGLLDGLNVYVYLLNEPIAWTDPTGLDRWIGQDFLGHKWLVVGPLPDGKYRKIHYGPRKGWGVCGKGAVWIDTCDAPAGQLYRPSPIFADVVCVYQATLLQANPPDYNLFTNNCIDFVDRFKDVGLRGCGCGFCRVCGGRR